ncbi:MAG: hypothetical protein SOW92_04120 [Kiritimatiellia bacterium]|nr:hypothetical protein [Kiritimatiellia bacterium]
MMNINEILHETAETLRGFNWMEGIPVIVEEKADPDNMTETEIAQQSLCVVVGDGGFEPTVQAPNNDDPNSVIGSATVVVSVFEKPIINRADEEHETIKALSRKIGKALAWCQAEGMAAPLFLRRITPISLFRVEGDQDAIVTRDVEFTTTAEL